MWSRMVLHTRALKSEMLPEEVEQGVVSACYGWSAVVCDVHVVG
jgi:hypothetical protein